MKKVKAFCHLPWYRAKIQCDGKVQMCCHQVWSNLGNLFERSFDEIWFDPEAEDVRNKTLNGELHPRCSTQECPFSYIEKKPKEFVVNDNGYPLELELDLHVSHCNFGGKKADPKSTCIMCPRAAEFTRDLLEHDVDRTDELVEKLKHLMPHLNSLCIMGLAEVFWEDKLFDVFDALDFLSHRDHIHFWTNTNGSLFDIEKQKKYVEYVQKGTLHFSIDAASPETFLKIRKNKVYDKILDNLAGWSSWRKELNKQSGVYHELVIANNINILNVDEVPKMIWMALEMDVDRIILSPTNNASGANRAIAEIMPNARNYKKFVEAEKEARRLAKDLGVKLSIPRPLDIGFSTGGQLVQITLI